jgi:hypothetical protein
LAMGNWQWAMGKACWIAGGNGQLAPLNARPHLAGALSLLSLKSLVSLKN